MKNTGTTKHSRRKSESTPTLSVVVPTYNSTNDLKVCLAALAESDYDDFDVLVVDDGSTEPVKPLVDGHNFNYLRIDGPSGPARARNRGVELARGRHLVFIDADVCVHRDTLARFAATFAADPTIDAVIGSYDDAPAKPNFISQYKNLFHHFIHQQSGGEISTFWTGCGAIRRDVFVEFGGFDEVRYRRPAIEDIELGACLTAAGRKIVLDRQIQAKHLKRWTLLNLLKTDIMDRGIPWTRLMMRSGGMVNTLNVTPAQRISVALVYLALLSTVAALLLTPALFIALAMVAGVTLLNLDFYRFFIRNSGFWFTLRVVPFHWLYFWYCGFSFAAGGLLHFRDKFSGNLTSTPTMPLRPDAHA